MLRFAQHDAEKHKDLSNTLLVLILLLCGCARLFGWDIHAPGMLSNNFYSQTAPAKERVALYIPPESLHYLSQDRGGRLADPQTYHIGEAFSPMLVEAFQKSFDEFIFFEVEPTRAMLERYGIPYLVVVRISEFKNRVTIKGQGVTLAAETLVFGSNLNRLARFRSSGTSDAAKIFAKKGGPEVNLNAAIENNIVAVVQFLQDSLRTGAWKGSAS